MLQRQKFFALTCAFDNVRPPILLRIRRLERLRGSWGLFGYWLTVDAGLIDSIGTRLHCFPEKISVFMGLSDFWLWSVVSRSWRKRLVFLPLWVCFCAVYLKNGRRFEVFYGFQEFDFDQ